MSLAGGRELVAIPGPSVIPDRVLNAMHRAMPDIYGDDLLAVSDEIYAELPRVALASPDTKVFVAISNGHGAWEMAISNTLSRGDTVLVLESGRFAVTWGEMAAFNGVKTEVLHAPDRCPVDAAAVEARLRADLNREIKAIFMVCADTASSVVNDVPAVRRALDAADHPALLMVDCIASMGAEEFRMADWGVDLALAASQKALMVPPGLGFVWAGPRALAAHATADMRTGYFDWTARMLEGAHYLRYCGTMPVAHLYGLREALAMIREEGLEHVWARHAALAGAVRAAVSAWATPDGFELNVLDPRGRSNAVTTILTGSIDAVRLSEICRSGAGLTLGTGIGDFVGRAFRIGHMGHVNPPMILGALGTIEAALAAMDAPIGSSGVAAAAAHLGPLLR